MKLGDRKMTEKTFLQPLTGDFQSGPITAVVALKGDTALTLTMPGQPVYNLVPVRGTKFNIKELNGYSVEFKGDDLVFYQPNGHIFSEEEKMMFDLTGQVAVVTGSTKGIGRAIAEELARAGAKVVISSRKADACEEVAAAIVEEGHEAIAIPCHIGRRADCEALIAKTREKWGKIDTLVCNAAINPYYGPMTGLADEVFNKVMETNVRSNLWLANLVQPEMAARKRWVHHYCVEHRRAEGHGDSGNLRDFEGGGYATGAESGGRMGSAEYSRELHRAGSGADGFRAGAVGGSGVAERIGRSNGAAPIRRAGGHRWRRCFFGIARGPLDHRADHRDRRRKDHRMKAAVLREFAGPIAIEEVETPSPGPGEVRGEGRGMRRVPFRFAPGAGRLGHAAADHENAADRWA